MVVIGGAGTRWGAVLGGIVYTFLDNRLLDWSDSQTIQDLPTVLSTPLSEPLFVLGTLFILLVYFLPGGIVGLARLRPRRSGVALLDEPAPAAVAPEGEGRL
jgi:branched-chain amino acid transport system permease protein